MLISTNHVLFEGCRSWLAVMYSTPLTAKGPWYLQHVTMKSRSLFSTGHEEQLLAVTYSMSVTIVTPCSVHHTTMNSRSLFCTPHHCEQSLPVLYRTLRAIARCYLQHVSYNTHSLYCTARLSEVAPCSLHPQQYVPITYSMSLWTVVPCSAQKATKKSRSHLAVTFKQEALNTLITPIHLTWRIYDKKRNTRPDGIMNFTMTAIKIKIQIKNKYIKYCNQQKHV